MAGAPTVLLSPSRPIWSLSVEEAERALRTGPDGLSETEAEQRLQRFGPNRLPPVPRRPLWRRFADQLVHFMALLLWAAGAMAFAARTPQLGWAIWSVILINAVFSFWQEFQAERTLDALTRVLPRQVRVCRDGAWRILPIEQLVPGDRLALEEGDQVPADCRLVRASGLYLDVAVLTGESLPVARQVEPQEHRAALPVRSGRLLRRPGEEPLEEAVAPGERTNLLLAGTTVAAGHGEAVVYATGGETEFAQVAHLAAATRRSPSTLELQVNRIVRTITTIAVSMGALAFGASVLFVGLDPSESLVFAIGIIVANVPEGLLPTVTLALALAVQRMARRNALVRRLSAVETLGAVGVICTDKTGTLTCNRMEVETLWLPPDGHEDSQAVQRLLLGAALCSNARLAAAAVPLAADTSATWRVVGDPTETALLLAASRAGLDLAQLPALLPRRREIPFDSRRRMMTVVVDTAPAAAGEHPSLPPWPEPAPCQLITKGAPLEVLRHCRRLMLPGGIEPLSKQHWGDLVAANDRLAARGFRVLAVAWRPGGPELEQSSAQQLERDLTFLGLIGLYDPPRPGVREAIAQCHAAGIKVTMVTGDYGLTAEAIACQIGLLDADPADPPGLDPVRVISGDSLNQLRDAQLRQLLRHRSRLVFARMAPEQKLRLVESYRSIGEVVAVTGDGVNDAPALRAADVGVAMGGNGTDVAREAADIVLLDDDFTTIVVAIRYGRAVFRNIRKFITYILSSNVPEVAPFLAMVAFRIPAALTVLQILAVDLGTDLLPALALGAEPPDPDVMAVPPRRRGEALLNRPLMQRAYLFLGLIQALLSMGAYLLVWRHHGYGIVDLQVIAPQLLQVPAPPPLMAIQTQASAAAFATIVFAQIGNLMACRSERLSAFALPWLSNRLLGVGISAELLVLAALLTVPPLASVFRLAPFPAPLWIWVVAAAPVLLLAEELRKACRRRRPTAH